MRQAHDRRGGNRKAHNGAGRFEAVGERAAMMLPDVETVVRLTDSTAGWLLTYFVHSTVILEPVAWVRPAGSERYCS
jgi:hypothetical protein